MTEETTTWRRMWDAIDRARKELWEAEAKIQERFFIAIRVAITEYAREVDPEAFDEYGQPREDG